MSQRIDVYQAVADRIILAIERGAGEFQLPWYRRPGSITRPTNTDSTKPYRGNNVVTLWIDARLGGYAIPVWGTCKQFQEAECQVRKSDKASLVILDKEIEFERDAPESASDDERTGSA